MGDRHLATVPQGVAGDRLPSGGGGQGGGGNHGAHPEYPVQRLNGLVMRFIELCPQLMLDDIQCSLH